MRIRTLNIRIGRLSRWVSAPGYGWCHRCRTTWAYVTPHQTRYNEHSSCFPLCEKCWADLTPAQRVQYYEELIAEWGRFETVGPNVAEQIRAAVLAGK